MRTRKPLPRLLSRPGGIRADLPEYNSWNNAIQRCTNRKNPSWRNYGGRGISVCDRWLDSFENFLADMGKRPAGEYSLGRRDNDGDYTPENCRWETNAQQSRNRRGYLSNAEVVAIRELAWQGVDRASIAEAFEVSVVTVRAVAILQSREAA